MNAKNVYKKNLKEIPKKSHKVHRKDVFLSPNYSPLATKHLIKRNEIA